MKAILILEKIPKSCYGCPCMSAEYDICQATDGWAFDDEKEKPCPLITEEQYVNRVYPVLYDMVVREILRSKILANKVSTKNIGEEE